MSAGPQERDRAKHAHQGPPRFDLSRLRKVKPRQYLTRFAFGASISIVAAVATEAWGPRVGGLFLAFPAILPATVTLLEKDEGLAQALSDIRGATLGAIGMIAFAGVVAALVRHSGAAALAGALAAWIVVAGIAYLVMRGTVRALGERQYLPEVPTVEGARLLSALMDRKLTIATAESCSGGMVAALLASLPDAGEAFRGGLVLYTDDLKERVGEVPRTVLDRDGAVSASVAAAMAAGARRVLDADVAVAVTGVTGSGAGGKPPGLTFVAVAMPGGTTIRCFDEDLGPGRNDERAVRMALTLAAARVTGSPPADQLPGTPVDGHWTETG